MEDIGFKIPTTATITFDKEYKIITKKCGYLKIDTKEKCWEVIRKFLSPEMHLPKFENLVFEDMEIKGGDIENKGGSSNGTN